MNIYVGNLAYRTTEDDLRQQFERFGTVSRVDIISDRETGRSKGFGFVEMPSSDEANAAIQALDGVSVGERALKVNEARERPPRGQGTINAVDAAGINRLFRSNGPALARAVKAQARNYAFHS